jgi:hypothetical protein
MYREFTVNWIAPIWVIIAIWAYHTGAVSGWTIALILLAQVKLTTTHS